MKQTITVLQDDIDKGVPGSARRCAIALAANRELFRNDITVGGRYLTAGTEFHAVLPGTAVRFIPVFDYKRSQAEPFKFEIETVDGPVPAAFRGPNLSSWIIDEVMFGSGGGVIVSSASPAAHHYEQMGAYKYQYDQGFSTQWTPEFGSVPVTYTTGWEPPAWVPDGV